MDNPVLKLHWVMANTIVVVCLFFTHLRRNRNSLFIEKDIYFPNKYRKTCSISNIKEMENKTMMSL